MATLLQALESDTLPSLASKSDEITWTVEFRDDLTARKFVAFHQISASPSLVWALAAVLTIFYIIYWSLVFSNYYSTFALVIAVISFCACFVPIWIVAVLRSMFTSRARSPTISYVLPLLETFLLLAFVICTGLVLLLRFFNGPCATNDFVTSFDCYTGEKDAKIPTDTGVALLVIPVIFYIVFPNILWRAILVANLLGIAFVVAALVLEKGTNSVAIMFIVMLFCLSVQFMYRYQTMQLFLATSKFHSEFTKRVKEEEFTEKLNFEMKNVISAISHDLKTPLAAFVSGLDMIKQLLTTLQCEAQHCKSLPQISSTISSMLTSLEGISSAHTMLLMSLNRFVDYTKSFHEIALIPLPQVVNFTNALQEVLSTIENLHGKNKFIIQHVDENISNLIITDRQWLVDNLLCLLCNGIKYASNAPTKLRILSTNEAMKNSFKPANQHPSLDDGEQNMQGEATETSVDAMEVIRFEVEDEGNGLSQEQIVQCFSPGNFLQSKEMGGSGIGLFCLYKRMQALQGCCGVNATFGVKGNTFWFCIPYLPHHGNVPQNENSLLSKSLEQSTFNQESKDSMSSQETDKMEKIETKEFDGKQEQKQEEEERKGEDKISRVLIVDDSLPILKMFTMMLKKAGFEVSTANNGLEAVQMLFPEMPPMDSKLQFQVVLMDINMPVVDGFQATALIRQKEQECQHQKDASKRPLLIVAMSANADPNTISDAIQHGANYFLPKPFQFQNLQKLIDEYFRSMQSASNKSG